MKHLKIAVPTDGRSGLNDKVANHFGRCRTYTFLDEKGEILEIADNTSEHMGGKGLPPELLKARGADILLCRDLGPKALNLCKKFKMEVYTAQAEGVKEIFEMWRDNKLKKAGAGDTCEQHET